MKGIKLLSVCIFQHPLNCNTRAAINAANIRHLSERYRTGSTNLLRYIEVNMRYTNIEKIGLPNSDLTNPPTGLITDYTPISAPLRRHGKMNECLTTFEFAALTRNS